VLQRANIAIISPSNTNPGLTQGADTAKPKRTYSTYFRVCTTDLVQGPFAADYVFKTLRLTRVATVNDTKTYGQGLASTFEARFKSLGGTITRSATIAPTDTDFSGTISQVAASKPQLVYYGGEYPQAGPLSKQMQSAGVAVPLMGGTASTPPSTSPSVAAPTTCRPRSVHPSSRCRRVRRSSTRTRPATTPSPTARTAPTPTTRPTH